MALITSDSNTVTSDSNQILSSGGEVGGTPTLPVSPDNALALDNEPKVTVSKFGDGYEQRAASGINNDLQKWDIRYHEKQKAVADTVYDFLKARGAVEAFYWTPPGESTPRLFVARKYRRRYPYGVDLIQTITTTFEEVPA